MPREKGFFKLEKDKNKSKKGGIKKWEAARMMLLKPMALGQRLKKQEEESNNKLVLLQMNIINKAVSKSSHKQEVSFF